MIANLNMKNCVLTAAEHKDKDKKWPAYGGGVVDRSKVMSASEALSCVRKQWYKKNGAVGSEQDWGFARRGTHMEKYFIDALQTYCDLPDTPEMTLSYVGEDQISIVDKDTNISATPDGVIDITMGKSFERFGLEFKSIDPRKNLSKLPTEAHVTQLQIAMALLNKYVYASKSVVKKEANGTIKKGILVYMDASNYNKITEFEVLADDGILEKMRPRASKVLRTEQVANLDREGKTTFECKQCEFKGPCGIAIEAPVKGRANRNSNVDVAVARYLDIKDQQDVLKANRADCGEEIKQELMSRNVSELMVGSAKVALKIVNGRRSINRELVAQAGLDLSPFETVGAPSERLEIKLL
jgi:hypothetical protein